MKQPRHHCKVPQRRSATTQNPPPGRQALYYIPILPPPIADKTQQMFSVPLKLNKEKGHPSRLLVAPRPSQVPTAVLRRHRKGREVMAGWLGRMRGVACTLIPPGRPGGEEHRREGRGGKWRRRRRMRFRTIRTAFGVVRFP
nr:hypothetical protein CFP56_11917 [Quercus suber]